jgi:hypothetical protein
MAGRKSRTKTARTTTSGSTGANVGYEAELWKMADAFRGSMDAAEYKHVVLGLIFLKYISDAFEEQHARLETQKKDGADPEDPDEYRAQNIFWVPPEARWPNLKAQARQSTIGQLVDAAMEGIERDNPSLKNVLPKDYARPALDKQRLGQLGWSIGSILDYAELLSGGTPKTDNSEYWNGEIPWASAKDVSQCGQTFLVHTARAITETGLEKSSTQLIPVLSTVIVARGATTGRLVLFGREMAMNQTCYGLRSLLDVPFTLYCQLRNEIEKFVHAAHGSVFDTITTRTFETARVLSPSQPVLSAFERVVSPLFRSILVNINQVDTLVALRDMLLPKLISGEIRVRRIGSFQESVL